jgi:uncharacterized membrane protein
MSRKEQLQIFIGHVLLAGLLVALVLTIVGGVFYLIFHGEETHNYRIFQQPPPVKTWHAIFSLSSYGVIQLGILVLVLTQLLRVFLVAWYYFELHDLKFVWFSLFILAVLIYSLFVHSLLHI